MVIIMNDTKGKAKQIFLWILPAIGIALAAFLFIYGGCIAIVCWPNIGSKLFGRYLLFFASVATAASLAGAVLGFFCIRVVVRRIKRISAVSIRRVQPGDEGILAYIQTESWKSAFKDIVAPDKLERCTQLDRAKAMYKGLLDENKGNGYILVISGTPHCIAYWDASREADMPDCAELICIHSLPDNRRKGYGSIMMDAVLRDVRAAGFTKIMLWVFEENTPAIRFYEKHGFVATERKQTSLDATEVMYEKIY